MHLTKTTLGKRFLDAQYMGSNMRFANHSCDPNCKISVVWVCLVEPVWR